MRRILYYSLLCLLWVSVNSCEDEEASQPPTPSLEVDQTQGLLSETEFTFTVEQVDAGAVSVLPYGIEKPSLGGILIPASSFTNGKATVKFTYARVGTFQAVAVSNNHSGDGSIVKNSISPAKAVTITSNKATMGDFSFDGSTETVVDDDVNPVTVDITMPWSKHNDITALKLRFTKSDYQTKVTIGGTAQQPDTTANNFSAPVTYTATSQDNAVSTTYLVTVHVTPAETNTNFKSLSAIIDNKTTFGGSYKPATGRVLPAAVDNVAKQIVIYDTLGIDPGAYDSLSLDYALDGKFSYAKFADDNTKLKGKDTVDLTSQPLQLVVTPEDSTITPRATYKVYVTEAPKMHVTFPLLNPQVSGESGESFGVTMNVLVGTPVAAIASNFSFDAPASGAIITSLKIDGNTYPTPVAGVIVNYTKPVTVEATVVDGALTYIVTYTVTANVLKP